jgi:hypothetical protein
MAIHVMFRLCVLAAFSALVACQSVEQPKEQTILPPLEPDLPQLQLKLGWNGKPYQVPEPVIVPPEAIRNGYAAWERGGYNGNWPVKLSDGRTVVMMAGRFKTNDPSILRFGVFIVWVYRPDGTLQIEQVNDTETTGCPLPNAPKRWTIYEADGATKAVDVICFGHAGKSSITDIIFYEGGKKTRQYNVDGEEGIVLDEYAFDEGGHRTGVHEANGYFRGVLLYKP